MATQRTSPAGISRSHSDNLVVFVLVGLGFVVFDFTAGPIIDAINSHLRIGPAWIRIYVFILLFLLGSMAGQWAVLAVWAALGSQRLAVRLTLVPLSGAILFASLIGGFTITGDPIRFKEAFREGLLLPLLLAAIAIPPAVARVALGWRIALSTTDTSAPHAELQFTIPQMLGLTAALAAALGLARWGMADELARQGAATVYTSRAITGLVVIAWSAFVVMPAVWSALASQRISNGMVGLVIYAFCVSLLFALVLNALTRATASRGEAYPAVLSFNAGLLVSLMAALLAARWRGYVLVRS